MDIKPGITRSDLSKAFSQREKEINANSSDKEKKKKKEKIVKKKPSKQGSQSIFENFHSIDLLG